MESTNWPQETNEVPAVHSDEERSVCLATTTHTTDPILPVDRFSPYTKLKMVSAWMIRNCRSRITNTEQLVHSPFLTMAEVTLVDNYWITLSQSDNFGNEIELVAANKPVCRSGPLLSLSPIMDKASLSRVGGRQNQSSKPYNIIHPIIIHGKHPLTKLTVRSEHLRMMHAGVTLVHASLSRRFHIISGHKVIRCVIRQCVICRKHSVKPENQRMGDLPVERITPDRPFTNVGVDYAGTFQIKYGYVHKPTIVKA